ncbi:MAG TPA: response regulator [Candidatus Saccharimonadales bacterium]
MTKILLVEDDKSLREIYGVRLLAEGYDIVSAGDGEEALAMAIKERPQLIVSDVMMPKISGFDMLDILRSTTETKDIKVIMMTALSSEDQRARGEALGADRYLVKSQVGIEDVVRTVHDVLSDAPVSAPGTTNFAAPAPANRPTTPAVPPRQSAPAYQTPNETPAPGGLPQPTAPFSTPRPANLGDRVIHPMPQSPDTKPDLGSLIDQELGNAAPVAPAPAAPVAPTPAATPAPAPQPQPPVMPPAPTAAPVAPPPVPPAPTNPTQPPAPTAY